RTFRSRNPDTPARPTTHAATAVPELGPARSKAPATAAANCAEAFCGPWELGLAPPARNWPRRAPSDVVIKARVVVPPASTPTRRGPLSVCSEQEESTGVT